jgi:hypothetical protein
MYSRREPDRDDEWLDPQQNESPAEAGPVLTQD